jgi:hypothetical protein
MISLVSYAIVRRSAFIVVVLFPVILHADLSDADITVLKGLHAAHRAAEQAFPHGRVKGSAENEFTATKATFDAVWDGDKYYIDADCTEVVLQPDGEKVDLRTRRIEIRTPNGRDYYQPENRLLQRITDNQGQRTLNSFDTKDLHEEVIIPAAELAFHGEAFFARVLLQER